MSSRTVVISVSRGSNRAVAAATIRERCDFNALLACFLATLLLLTIPATAGAVTGTSTQLSTDSSTQPNPSIEQRTVLEHGGGDTVVVTERFHVDESVKALTVSAPPAPTDSRSPHKIANVDSLTGFDTADTDGHEYEWSREKSDPDIVTLTIEYTLHPHYVRVGDDSATAFTTSRTQFSLDFQSSAASDSIDTRAGVTGEGVAGDVVAYFGPVDTYTARRNGVTYTLWVPKESQLNQSTAPTELISSLSESGTALNIGNHTSTVTILSAPPDQTAGHRPGLMWLGPAEGWVAADRPTDGHPSIWHHELTHITQPYATSNDMLWYVEGSAQYYGHILPANQRDQLDGVEPHLARSTDGDLILSDRSTWDSPSVAYQEGAIMLAALDWRIREATGHEQTLLDLHTRIAAEHSWEDPLTQEKFIEHIAVVSNRDTANWMNIRLNTQFNTTPPESPMAYKIPELRNSSAVTEPAGALTTSEQIANQRAEIHQADQYPSLNR